MNTNHQNDVLLREFREKFPGVLETRFEPKKGDYPVPSITRFVEGEIQEWLKAAFDKVRAGGIVEGRKEIIDLAMSNDVLAKSHSLIYKKRKREVTLEDDAICKCFRQVLQDEALSPPSGGSEGRL